MKPFALLALTCLLAGTARGEQVPGWLSKLSIHGYLSQAWAVSDDHQIFGIPTGGTADYRDLAVQFRYDPNRKNSAVVQLRHARFGDSPRQHDDVEVDWAFYQHHFSDRLSVKAGRIPLPLGIFNEAGGPAGGSPFFLPPTEFYERRYSSKTFEGALASFSLGDPAGWSFDVDGYAGRWTVDYGLTQHADARGAWGAQVWANTPWTGVRIGGGAYRCDVYPPEEMETDYLMLHASAEADLDRWRLASEYIRGNLETRGRYRAWYAQAGYQFTPRLSVHARGTVAHIDVPISGVDADVSEDLGLAVNFAVHPNALLKLEGHTNDGLLMEDEPYDFTAPGFSPGEPLRTRYLIASITLTY
jgi:hypothetical protein